MMADIEHIKDRQERENYRFSIAELGGQMPKPDRIRRLVPLFENNRVFLPHTLPKTDYEGNEKDLVNAFIDEEYKAFPVGLHDDMLDALARILDETDEFKAQWPAIQNQPERYAKKYQPKRAATSWMAV